MNMKQDQPQHKKKKINQCRGREHEFTGKIIKVDSAEEVIPTSSLNLIPIEVI